MSSLGKYDPGRIPAELRERAQWVVWRFEERDGRRTKVPYDTKTGKRASTTEPATWSTFAAADHACALRRMDGVGFVVAKDDPYVAYDLDGCLSPTLGMIEEWAADIVRELDSYTEVTPSGRGLRIIVRGTLPPGRRQKDFPSGEHHGIGVYDRGRFVTMTGQIFRDCRPSIGERREEIEAIHDRLFGPAPVIERRPSPSPLSLTDTDLIENAMNASNGAAFRALWSGDASDYASRSEADAALVNFLAFYSQGDEATIDRLFRQSGLYREKWDRDDYRSRTIDYVLGRMTSFYEPHRNGTTVVAQPAENPEFPKWKNSADSETEALLDRLRTLEVENRRLREDNERQRKTISAQAALFRNPNLKPAHKLVTVAVVNETGWRESRGELGPYVINCGRLAEAVGVSKHTVARALEILSCDEGGIIERRVTRDATDVGDFRTVLEIRPRVEGGIAALLLAAAELVPPPEDKPAAKRPECNDHPASPPVERRIVSCSECGTVLLDVYRILYRDGPTAWQQHKPLDFHFGNSETGPPPSVFDRIKGTQFALPDFAEATTR